MSLLASVNSGAPTQPYFIANSGTSSVPEIATPTGTIQIQPNSGSGNVFIQAGTSNDSGSVHIGANPVFFDGLVVESNPVDRVRVRVPLLTESSLTVQSTSDFQGSINLNNQQILGNLRYTQIVLSVPNGTNDAPLNQPAGLPGGSYLINFTNSANFQFNCSAVGFWNGSQWTSGGTGTTCQPGSGIAVFIRPNVAGTGLAISNASGSAIAGFIYYTSIGQF